MAEGSYIKSQTGETLNLKKIVTTEQQDNYTYEKPVNLEEETMDGNSIKNDRDITGLNDMAVETSVAQTGITDTQLDDNESEHAGEEQVDIGLKDLPTGGPNIYVGKRNFIHQLMDVALLMANVSQLKALLSIDSDDKYFYPLLIFIILSISLQVIFTVTMLLIWSIEKGLEERTKEVHHPNDKVINETELSEIDEKKKILANRLDKFGNILVLSIIVSNVFITGFGVEPHEGGNSSVSNG